MGSKPSAFSPLSEGNMDVSNMIGILVLIASYVCVGHPRALPSQHQQVPPSSHQPPPQPQYPPQGYYPPQPGYYSEPQGYYPQQPQGYYPQQPQGYPQQYGGGVGGFDPITFAALGGLGGGNGGGIDPTALLALGGGLGGLGGGSPFDPNSVLALTGGLTGGTPGVAPNDGLLGDPSLLAIAGGMGNMAGPYNGAGIDPMTLLAMNANGIGGGIDGLLSAGLGGDGAGLFGLMLGGEGMRDPSKGISNMLDEGIITQGDDVDEDGEPDHLVETRHKIDDFSQTVVAGQTEVNCVCQLREHALGVSIPQPVPWFPQSPRRNSSWTKIWTSWTSSQTSPTSGSCLPSTSSPTRL